MHRKISATIEGWAKLQNLYDPKWRPVEGREGEAAGRDGVGTLKHFTEVRGNIVRST